MLLAFHTQRPGTLQSIQHYKVQHSILTNNFLDQNINSVRLRNPDLEAPTKALSKVSGLLKKSGKVLYSGQSSLISVLIIIKDFD